MTIENEPPRSMLISEPRTFSLELVRAFGSLRGGPLPADGQLLAGGPRADDTRGELIESVRAGRHLELEVPAITYLQEVGKPNRNGLKFSTRQLAKVARSGKAKPMLVDHNARQQAARIGTIVSTELVDGKLDTDPGGARFRQLFRVVKPEAVISVLDGTISMFSIGWHPTGPIVCSLHRSPIWDNCTCWPLDEVEIDNVTHIVEYEFTSAELDETSAVNTPAVTGTKIEDVRAALAVELRTYTDRRPDPMLFPRLAAALSLAALNEADDATAADRVTQLGARATRAETELATLRTQHAEVAAALVTRTTERDTALAAATTALATKKEADINATIENAYRTGRLALKRDAEGKRIASKTEASLRTYGERLGAEALATYVDEMPEIIPISQRALADDTREDPRPAPTDVETGLLNSAATQLGVKPELVVANAKAAREAAENRTTRGGR